MKKGRRGEKRRKRPWKSKGLVLKRVFCKTCRNCKGHGPYRYRVYRKGKKIIWEYLGKAQAQA